MLTDRILEAIDQAVIDLIEDSTVGDLVFPVTEEQVQGAAEGICGRFALHQANAGAVAQLLNVRLDRYWEGVA